jgi:hypothetical protein
MTPQARRTLQEGVQTPSVLAFTPSATSTQPISPSSKISTPQNTRVKAEPKVKKEPTSGHWSPAKTTPKIKNVSKLDDTYTSNSNSPFITGVYIVTSPHLSSQYANEAKNFRFFLCVDNEAGKIWGGFELASKSGVLCIADYTNIDDPLSFGWRARDSQRGESSFGRGCFGTIHFSDDRRFTATVFNMFPEPVELRGERRSGPLWCGKSAWQFEREWDGFVTEAYGR